MPSSRRGVTAHGVTGRGAAGARGIAPPGTLRTDDQIAGCHRQAAKAIGPDVPFVLPDYFERDGSMRRIAIPCGNNGLCLGRG